MSETQPPTVGTSAPQFTPGRIVSHPTWTGPSIIYYATDGITEIRLNQPSGVEALRGRERVIALALLDYARELVGKEEAA